MSIIAVGAGGFVGAVLRYLIGLIPVSEKAVFPIKTFVINIVGCLAIGMRTIRTFFFFGYRQQSSYMSIYSEIPSHVTYFQEMPFPLFNHLFLTTGGKRVSVIIQDKEG